MNKEFMERLGDFFIEARELIFKVIGIRLENVYIATNPKNPEYRDSGILRVAATGEYYGIAVGLGNILDSNEPFRAVVAILCHEVGHYLCDHLGRTQEEKELLADGKAVQILVACGFDPWALDKNLVELCEIHGVSIYEDTFGWHPCTAKRIQMMDTIRRELGVIE